MWRALPGILFLTIVLFLFYVVYDKSTKDGGVGLIGQAAPEFYTNKIEGYASIPSSDIALKHRYTLVNFFASWCTPCLAEHPFLTTLAKKDNITVIGIAWRDSKDNITTMLKEHGNPYHYVGIDNRDSTASLYGVKGLPESYLINPEGVIVEMHQGPLVPETIKEKILPYLQH